MLLRSRSSRQVALRSTAGKRKGGTLRLGHVRTSTSSTRRSRTPAVVDVRFATCAKLFNYPDAPGAAGTSVMPEVVDRYCLEGRRAYTFT